MIDLKGGSCEGFHHDWSWLGMGRHERIDRYGLFFSSWTCSLRTTDTWIDVRNVDVGKMKDEWGYFMTAP